MKHNFTSIEEIERFARYLEGSTIGEQNSPYCLTGEIKEGPSKGGFGQYLENAYFGLETNSYSQPDFYPLPLELKATPLKYNSANHLVPKERLVLNIIDYKSTAEETSIYSSHFLMKNGSILLVWYIHASADSYKEMKINLTGIWKCLEEDKDQIIEDWNFIVKKIKAGKAHELSEGDTLYLGACTKGATAASSLREQYGTDIPAKQRAFCFKIQYMNVIYKRMLEKKSNRKEQKRFCKAGETLQEKIIALVRPYIGRTLHSLVDEFGLDYSKQVASRIILYILGTGGKKPQSMFYEFAAADIQIKTIKVDKGGKNRESMSFPAINYCKIVDEEWEDSDLYQQLTRKFLCPIFVYDEGADDLVFDRCTIWNMPESDLEIVKGVWEDTRSNIEQGIYDKFVKISDNRISHIRPHAQNKADTMITPQGTYETKKCFWLNAQYVYEQIVSKKTVYTIWDD